MKKWVKRIAIMILTLALLAAALWTWSRLRGPTAEQREALALMTETETPAGRNAFAALWTLRYDVPEEEQAAVVAEDVAHWVERIRQEVWDESSPVSDDPVTIAKGRYRDLRMSEEDRSLLCRPVNGDCLASVRDDPEAYAALLDGNQRLFERVEALSGFDYYRSEMPSNLLAPYPEFQRGQALATRHAVWFVQGQWDAALDGACRDLSTWRRLGAYSDSLLVRMIGTAFSSKGNARLLAAMLAELPGDYPLPSSCERALAPPGPDELSMCEVMRGELRFAASQFQIVGDRAWAENRLEYVTTPLVFDLDMSVAELATGYAPACSEAQAERLAADESIEWPEWDGWWRLECVSNWVGCTLAGISRPAFSNYHLRTQDHAARLRLMGALLWLRERAGDQRPLNERLAELPEEFVTQARRPEIGEDGTTLRIRQFYTQQGEFWEIPLPPYLRDGTGAE